MTSSDTEPAPIFPYIESGDVTSPRPRPVPVLNDVIWRGFIGYPKNSPWCTLFIFSSTHTLQPHSSLFSKSKILYFTMEQQGAPQSPPSSPSSTPPPQPIVPNPFLVPNPEPLPFPDPSGGLLAFLPTGIRVDLDSIDVECMSLFSLTSSLFSNCYTVCLWLPVTGRGVFTRSKSGAGWHLCYCC